MAQVRPADERRKDAVGDPWRDPAEAFIEQMGLIAQADHLPRIAGRMLGLFLVEGRLFGQRELAARLRVSRGSVSTNARLLAQLGLLERVAKPGDRQDYYRLAADPYARLLAGFIQRMTHSHHVVTQAAASFPEDGAGARQRLQELAEFYKASAECLKGLLSRF